MPEISSSLYQSWFLLLSLEHGEQNGAALKKTLRSVQTRFIPECVTESRFAPLELLFAFQTCPSQRLNES